MASSENADQDQETSRSLGLLMWCTLGVACGLQFWLWSRSWLYLDQVVLYRLATDLASFGELHAYAKGMTGGAILPGSMLQLVLGGALLAWFDFRSPTLWLVIFHIASLPLIYRSMRNLAGTLPAQLLTLLWAASPWRLYHGAFLWEPNVLLLLAPVHFWAFERLHSDGVDRNNGRTPWWPSLALGLAVAAAPQLHPSGLIVGVGTLLMMMSRQIKLNWWTFIVGCAASSISLLGTLRLVLRGDLSQAAGAGRLNLLQLDVLKPIAFWLRLPAGDLGRRINQSEVIIANGVVVVAVLFIALALAANWKLWTRVRSGSLSTVDRYALAMIGASLLTHSFARTNPQGWHSLIVLLPALLPVVALLVDATPRNRNLLLAAILSVHFFIVGTIGLGHPMYQRPTNPEQLRTVAPENLPHLQLVPIPFGSGKENWDAAQRNLARRSATASSSADSPR